MPNRPAAVRYANLSFRCRLVNPRGIVRAPGLRCLTHLNRFVQRLHSSCGVGKLKERKRGSGMRWTLRILASTLVLGAISISAEASPWAEVGDAQIRSDVEILAAAGIIDDVTTQWPLPWGGILQRLEQAHALADEPDYVRAAADRLEQEANIATATGRMNYAVNSDVTNLPDVVRG